jgi:hypothetical protein
MSAGAIRTERQILGRQERQRNLLTAAWIALPFP